MKREDELGIRGEGKKEDPCLSREKGGRVFIKMAEGTEGGCAWDVSQNKNRLSGGDEGSISKSFLYCENY